MSVSTSYLPIKFAFSSLTFHSHNNKWNMGLELSVSVSSLLLSLEVSNRVHEKSNTTQGMEWKWTIKVMIRTRERERERETLEYVWSEIWSLEKETVHVKKKAACKSSSTTCSSSMLPSCETLAYLTPKFSFCLCTCSIVLLLKWGGVLLITARRKEKWLWQDMEFHIWKEECKMENVVESPSLEVLKEWLLWWGSVTAWTWWFWRSFPALMVLWFCTRATPAFHRFSQMWKVYFLIKHNSLLKESHMEVPQRTLMTGKAIQSSTYCFIYFLKN